ncbi:twin-arginine translocation signal domain-containing protein [Halomontanus rarus]|uniref:twin-arginine translocation signal domain-containing protein n=1 Tax=Halomontanus rarus TaxID=3034020 RepID=UPI001A997839
MRHENNTQHVTDEERRDFLKALGLGGVLTAGGLTLGEVREQMATESATGLSTIGESIRADLTGTLEAEALATQQETFVEAVNALPAAAELGLPEEGRREEFATLASAGRPVYDHLGSAGFFESTTQNLPAFGPQNLESSVEAFASSEALAAPLEAVGFTGQEGVDMLATVVANARELATYHWVATDEIPRERFEFSRHVPPMTKAASGGVLLWMENLDEHIWKKRVLLTGEILEAADWHVQAMAAGFQLMTEGAAAIADESGRFSNQELGALFSTAFAVQAIEQAHLANDVYWITEKMRAPRRTDLKTITS